MALALIILFVATAGSKLVLAGIVIYAILPAHEECSACNGETVPIRFDRGLDLPARWVHLQRRWCTRCGELMLRRGVRPIRVRVRPAPTNPASPPSERVPPERS